MSDAVEVRAPYHTTESGLYRTSVRHPVTGARVHLSSKSLAELMGRRSRWEELRRELSFSMKCPHCGGELVSLATEEAASAEAERLGNLNEGKKALAAVTIAGAFDLYRKKSPPEHRKKLGAIFRHQVEPFLSPATPIRAVTAERAERWIAALEREGYAGRSIRGAYSALKGAYAAARASGCPLPRACPFAGVRLPPVGDYERRLLSRQELARLVAAAGGPACERGRKYLFAALTGLRNGELAALSWDDLSLREGVMRVRHTALGEWRAHYPGKSRPDFPVKARRARSVRLHPQAVEILAMQARWLKSCGWLRASGPVWPATEGEYAGKYRNNAEAIRAETIQRDAEAAGIAPAGISAHALRHAFGSWEVHAGNDLASTSARLRHASVRTTADIYVHPAQLPPSRIAAFDWEELTPS